MKKLTKTFIKLLLTKVNTIHTCYYEEAKKNAAFPYCVIPTLTFSPLNGGYTCLLDIELYTGETTEVSIEEMLDNLREGLDGFSEITDGIGYHLGFEDQIILKQNEQDLSARRITFSARIFK